MAFIKQDIPAKILCIIDIGSYKLRVCAASFKNKRIEILGYSEKRQDSSYFSNQECTNLPGLCTNISEAIEKLEKKLNFSLDDVIINYPFGEIFLASKTIHHIRKYPETPLGETELESLLEYAEKHCFKHLTQEIEEKYGLGSRETQILLSRVNSISLDGEIQEKILHRTGQKVSISLVNAFIPSGKHNLLSQIGNVLGKKIYRILPTEFCIAKLFPQENLLIINVGATQTSLTLKKENEVRSLAKIPIGIQDLVHKIARKIQLPRAEIIQSLSDTSLYTTEKNDFLNVWGEGVALSLEEMLGDEICPREFFIGGGGGNNRFLQEYLENLSFASYDIKVLNRMVSIQEDVTAFVHAMKSITLEEVERMPLDMYVLLSETNMLLSQESDIISISLKHAIEKLGYIKS